MNKPDRTSVTFRLPSDLLAGLRDIAAIEQRSLTQIITLALTVGFRELKPMAGRNLMHYTPQFDPVRDKLAKVRTRHAP